MNITRFITKYKIGDNEYSSFVIAENSDNANNLIKLRGIGETIDGTSEGPNSLTRFSTLSDSKFLRHLPRIAHQICWISWMAANSGMVGIDDILGDEGILHEIIHLIDPSTRDITNLQLIKDKVAKLEDLNLGLFKD